MPSSNSQKSAPSIAGLKMVRPSLSIDSVGGNRPPVPTSTAAGSALPLLKTVTPKPVPVALISVAGRSEPNSPTRPATWTASPTLTGTAGVLPVKTKTASEVLALPSPAASWR